MKTKNKKNIYFKIKELPAKKKFKKKNLTLTIFGNILIEDKKIKLLIEKPTILSKQNGEFFFILENDKKQNIILGNSNTSHHQIFYKNHLNNIYLSTNIFNLIDSKSNINKTKVAEWLMINGRNFDNDSFFSNIRQLYPGCLVSFDKKIKYRENEPLVFNNIFRSEEYYLKKIELELKNSLKRRITDSKNISFALSGGYDSRIILYLLKKYFKNKVFTHTLGDQNSLEKKVAKTVANQLQFPNKDIKIKHEDYLKNAEKILTFGNYNSIFKNGIKRKIYKKLFNNKLNYFIQGNALDVLIGASFSTASLSKIRSEKKYIQIFKKSIKLFSLNETKKILNLNNFEAINKNHLDKLIRNRIKKIDYKKDFINLNDSLTFDIRIKRWHNPHLAVYEGLTNMLIPTYDKFFLSACSKIPSSYRINDNFRKKLLKNLSKKLFTIETPELLMLKIKKNDKYHPYDSDLTKFIRNNTKFEIFFKNMLLKHKSLSEYLNINYIKVLFNDFKTKKHNNIRKIFMITTLIITLNKFIEIKER